MRTFVLSFVFLSSIALPSAARSADRAAGVVVDQAGQLLPRAFVRVVDGSGRETASAFSDERGAFDLPAPASGCRVEGSLIGFATASVPCDSAGAVRVVLAVAPVQENVVVSATRTEALADQVGASVTTFTAEDIARRRQPIVGDLLRSIARRDGHPDRRTRRCDVAVRARRREQLQQGAARRHAAERTGRDVLLHQHRRPRTSNGSRSCAARSRRCSDRMRWPASSRCSRSGRRGTRKPSGSAVFEAGSFDTYRVGASAGGPVRALRLLRRRGRT